MHDPFFNMHVLLLWQQTLSCYIVGPYRCAPTRIASCSMAMMQPITVTQIYQVHVGSQQWIPTQKKVHGMHWFQCSKWDRGFHRFCTDKALDLRRKSDETKKGMNCVFFNELQAHCLKAFSGEMDRSTWAEEQEQKKKRRKVDIKKAAQSSDIPFVQVDLPGVELDGKSFGPITVKVLTEQIGSSVFWLELNQMNLEYLRAAVLSSEPCKVKGTHGVEDAVRDENIPVPVNHEDDSK